MAPFIALMILLLTVVLLYHNGRLQSITANLGFAMVVIAILMMSHYFFTFRTSVFWLAVFSVIPCRFIFCWGLRFTFSFGGC